MKMYEPQRLHPAAILEFLIKNAYKLVQAMLPLIILALGNGAVRRWFFLLLPLVLFLFIVYGILYWLRYVYYVHNDELRLEFGVLVRKKRFISFSRIQTVQVSAGVIQRIFGLVKLQVETAGGGSRAEMSLPAISRHKADELHSIIHNSLNSTTDVSAPHANTNKDALNSTTDVSALKADTIKDALNSTTDVSAPHANTNKDALNSTTDVSAPHANTIKEENIQSERNLVKYHLTTPSLLLLGSTSNSLGVVLAGLMAVISQLDEIVPGMAIWQRLGVYASNLLTGTVGTIILILAALFLIAWLLSLLGNILLFGGFSLIRDGDNIRISRGLLEKKQLTIPVKRIQAVRLVEGLLRQPFGMVSIKVVSISNTGEKGEGNVLMPIIAMSRAEDFLKQVVPEFYIKLDTEQLPARSRMRYILVNLIPAAVISIITLYFLPYGYLSLLLLLLAVCLGNMQYNDAGFKLQDDILVMRSRTLGRVRTIVPRPKIQSLSVTWTYFQARKELTSLKIFIASGGTAALVKLVGMDKDKSSAISQWFSQPPPLPGCKNQPVDD